MLYDLRLRLHYDYDTEVRGDRHLVRVMPASLPGQRVIAASLSFDPRPMHETQFQDFFGNVVTMVAYRGGHDHLDVRLSARVDVEDRPAIADLSPDLADLQLELTRCWSLGPQSPHHFVGPSPRIALDAKMGINYGSDRVRFITPVRTGARIRIRVLLLALDQIAPAIWQAKYRHTIEIEDEARPALVADTLNRIYLNCLGVHHKASGTGRE